jgi:hypothetical protein
LERAIATQLREEFIMLIQLRKQQTALGPLLKVFPHWTYWLWEAAEEEAAALAAPPIKAVEAAEAAVVKLKFITESMFHPLATYQSR